MIPAARPMPRGGKPIMTFTVSSNKAKVSLKKLAKPAHVESAIVYHIRIPPKNGGAQKHLGPSGGVGTYLEARRSFTNTVMPTPIRELARKMTSRGLATMMSKTSLTRVVRVVVPDRMVWMPVVTVSV